MKRLKNVVTANATPITTTCCSTESGAVGEPRADPLLDRVARERRAEERERRHEEQCLPRADRAQRVRHPHHRARVVGADAPREADREDDEERGHRAPTLYGLSAGLPALYGPQPWRRPGSDPGYDDWFDEPEPPTETQSGADRGVYEDAEEVWVLPEDEARAASGQRRSSSPARTLTMTQVAIIALCRPRRLLRDPRGRSASSTAARPPRRPVTPPPSRSPRDRPPTTTQTNTTPPRCRRRRRRRSSRATPGRR